MDHLPTEGHDWIFISEMNLSFVCLGESVGKCECLLSMVGNKSTETVITNIQLDQCSYISTVLIHF